MIGRSTAEARLCPYCANSIQAEAAKCPYCKAGLLADYVPDWLNRDEPSSEPRNGSNSAKKYSLPSKLIWPAGTFVVGLIAFFVGGYMQRSELLPSSQAGLKQLQVRDQVIQSQESQLTQLRQQLNDNATQLDELKAKLEESHKELSAAQQRLGVANREVARLNASRTAAGARTAPRARETARSFPAAARRTAAPGAYETTRETSVYTNASSASPVLSKIGRGTRINVVSSTAGWLEVRSKHGNPPGYVRSDDARPIGRAN